MPRKMVVLRLLSLRSQSFMIIYKLINVNFMGNFNMPDTFLRTSYDLSA